MRVIVTGVKTKTIWDRSDRNTYLMFDGIYYKIGQAYEPEKRLKSLRIGSPNIKLICYGKKISESHLHKLFESKRIEGEWFDLDKKDVACIKILLKKGVRDLKKMSVPYVEEGNLKPWHKQRRIIEQYTRLSDFIKYRPEVYELVKNKRWFKWEYEKKLANIKNIYYLCNMGKEIERKFLLAKGASIPIPARFIKVNIKQGYILVEKGAQLRVRIYGVDSDKKFKKCFICLKTTDKLIRDEYEYLIPEQDGKELYKNCKWSLEKKRLTFQSTTSPKVQYDIDTFPNGMQWIEVEFKSIKDMKKWEKKIPSWIGKEITGVSKYSNITLAKKNLKFNGKR